MNNPFIGELIGTMLLIIFGDGVVANVVLSQTKGQNSGWIVIATGWATAVAVGVYASAPISGAHINPAVTIGLAVIGEFTLVFGVLSMTHFDGAKTPPGFGSTFGPWVVTVLVWAIGLSLGGPT